MTLDRPPATPPTSPPGPPAKDRLRSGDVDALEACYRTHGARVHQICRRVLGNGPDALDAVQEVFVKVFERADQFAGRARFEAWLHRVAVNHCLNHLARERTRRAAPLEEGPEPAGRPECDPASPLEREEDRRRLRELLGRLPEDQRAVLLLREMESLSYAEIAEREEIPVGTVMSRLARAREKLWKLASQPPAAPAAPGPHRTPGRPSAADRSQP